MTKFEKDLALLINNYSLENETDTPDFILAEYLKDCLDAYTRLIIKKDQWWGRDTNKI